MIEFDPKPKRPETAEGEEEKAPDLLEIQWGGKTRTILKPTTGMFMNTLNNINASNIDIIPILGMFRQIMDEDMVEDVKRFLADPNNSVAAGAEEESDEVIRRLFRSIITAASGGSPSGSSAASGSSPSRGGATSTASKRRPASTRSTSRSPAS